MDGLLSHPQPWEIRQGELYYGQGWYFERMFEGTVKLRLQWGTNQGTVMIPVAAWERIIAHVKGEIDGNS